MANRRRKPQTSHACHAITTVVVFFKYEGKPLPTNRSKLGFRKKTSVMLSWVILADAEVKSRLHVHC